MWIYDNASNELVNISEDIHNIYTKSYNYDKGTEHKIHFKNIIKGNGFNITYKNKEECDNYFVHVIDILKPKMIDASQKPVKL